MTQYDYIIIGAGASGLMLADALGRDDFFAGKSILVLDKSTKNSNDRTWCYWERGEGRFDDIVSNTWQHISFGGQQVSKNFDLAPYTYKMVRGIDFYESYLERLRGHSNIDFRHEEVTEVADYGNRVIVTSDQDQYSVFKVFNSIFDYGMATHQNKYPVLQQHFVGWTVRTKSPIFDVKRATYMDFSVPQQGNTRFMYVLPFSEREALVEYTLFSQELLSKEEYESAIRHYLQHDLHCTDYEITDTEQGSIPMTCYDFNEHHTPNIRYIGTAGGWAKPSTGYTFMSSSKKVPVLVEYLKSGTPLDRLSYKNRFWYYDLLLLDVLAKNNGQGHRVFETLFKNRDPQLIFKFLDEETSLWEDLKFVMGCPTGPFVKALLARIFGKYS
ncbi:lycopene cyclase family protein [Pricia sp. S334]|uniref:Lycopene cyclase family protein n=1 Tax=Pricia mediterranea TaxID=3076079 RepID=A0ABU3L706_9FLAO|nr:lycopene cyclase family protein [Pricia sp. S334]MDT7829138.1 lycopene cyclase family protein [Pricia sp. S334]